MHNRVQLPAPDLNMHNQVQVLGAIITRIVCAFAYLENNRAGNSYCIHLEIGARRGPIASCNWQEVNYFKILVTFFTFFNCYFA